MMRASIAVALTDLCRRPNGPRDRQLLAGEAVESVAVDGDWSKVRAEKDGYEGWVLTSALADPMAPSHWVSAPATHAYTEADLKSVERISLSLGSQVNVTSLGEKFCETNWGFIPTPHLSAIDAFAEDPVAMAESLIGTPYLWGGNSRFGIDCSGLVQVAFNACGIPCPGDSGPQERSFGALLPSGTSMLRGDLLFWKGHVALVVDQNRLLHANAHTMSVAYEAIDAAIVRIETQGEGPVNSHKRVLDQSQTGSIHSPD